MKAHWFLLGWLGSVGFASAGTQDEAAAARSRSIVEQVLSLKRVRDDHDFEAFHRTTYALESLGPEDAGAFDAVAALLKDESEEVRTGAVIVLGRIGPAERAVPHLARALADPSHEVVDASLRALSPMGPAAREAVPALIEQGREAAQILQGATDLEVNPIAILVRIEPDPMPLFIREYVKADAPISDSELLILGQIALHMEGDAAPLIPRLVAALGQEGEDGMSSRLVASGALGRIGPRAAVAVPALSTAAQQLAEKGLSTPLSALLRLAPDGDLAEQTVRRCLTAESPDSRFAAALALARHDPTRPESLPVLLDLLGDVDASELIMREEFGALKILSELDRDGDRAVPALIEVLRRGEPEEGTQAFQALAQFGPNARRAVPELLKALESPTWSQRDAAAGALGAIGPDAREAAPTLAAMAFAKEKDPTDFHNSGRARACHALARVDPEGKSSVPALVAALDRRPMSRDQIGVILELAEMGPAARPLAEGGIRRHLDGENAVAAAYALARLGVDVADQVDRLVAAVRGEDETMVMPAIVALARLGADARPAASALAERLGERRKGPILADQLTAVALARIGPPAAGAVPTLRSRMRVEDGPLADWCSIAISRISPDAAVELPPADPAGDPETRRRRREARIEAILASEKTPLGVLDADPDQEGEVSLLGLGNLVLEGIELLRYYDEPLPIWPVARKGPPTTLAAACWATTRSNLDSKFAVPLLIEGLRHEDPFVRTTAAYSLGLLGRLAAGAKAALGDASKDPDAAVRGWASKALARIGG